jgi:hypothetical protein
VPSEPTGDHQGRPDPRPWHSPCSSAGGPGPWGKAIMSIRSYVSDVQLDSDTQRVLGLAMELTCLALRTRDCADDVKRAIAAKIIELAKSGERNPEILAVERNSRAAGVAPLRQPPWHPVPRITAVACHSFKMIARCRSKISSACSKASSSATARVSECHSCRQLFANAAIASSSVAS